MSGKITHCGDVGAGLVAKICNNMLLAITMIGTAECFNLGIKYKIKLLIFFKCKIIFCIFNYQLIFRLGLDPKVMMGIINSSTGRCWASEVNNPVPGLLFF